MKNIFCRLVTLIVLSALPVVGTAGLADTQKAVASRGNEQRVDINSATAEELMELPGIGEKVAGRIISYREDNGPFEKVEEIMNVRGIGERTFLKLQDRLVVGTGKGSRSSKSKKKSKQR